MSMCGITGWINFERDLRANVKQVEQMTDALAHRGPDAKGIHVNPHALLGHRRLAVIDLEGGVQPMTKRWRDKEYTIVYNGELYNTAPLREMLLQRGYSFTTGSDTEVLLTAFIEWQEGCTAYLNGIYAFAVWDASNKQLFMCRDRLGVKPFFYRHLGSGLLFASEIKALLAHEEVDAAITVDGLAAVLSLGPSRIPGDGIFHEVKEIKPGCAMVINRQGSRSWRYWDIASKVHQDNLQQTVENVRVLVTDAIERQLVSDVPLCTLLSGGLDSSIITAVAANHYKTSQKRLHTFSVDFESNTSYFEKNAFQQSQDQVWIDLMSERYGTIHHNVMLQQDQLVDSLEQAMLMKDLPSMADIDSSLLLFCKELKKDFTVSLSGECADEVFGGYPWLVSEAEGEKFPWIRSIHEREGLLNETWKRRLDLSGFLEDAYEQALNDMPNFGGSEQEIKRQQLFYLNNMYFMQTLLERKDRMSMATGLEVRVPFADHTIIEYAWNIPREMQRIGDVEKGILRKAFAHELPEEITWRKKNPFPKTYHPAYTERVKTLLKELLQNNDSILHELFDEKKIQHLIDSGGASFKVPWFGQLMAGPQLLAYLIQFHYWFEKYRLNILI